MVANTPMGLLRTWNVANMIEELNFFINLNLNGHMHHISAVLKDIHQAEWIPHGRNKMYEGLKSKESDVYLENENEYGCIKQ